MNAIAEDIAEYMAKIDKKLDGLRKYQQSGVTQSDFETFRGSSFPKTLGSKDKGNFCFYKK